MASVDDSIAKIVKKYGTANAPENKGMGFGSTINEKSGVTTKYTLTDKQQLFLDYIVYNDMDANDALVKAYPGYATYTPQKRRSRVCGIMNNPRVKKKYNEMLEKKRAELVAEAKWTRDTAIEALKFIYNTNRAEHERVEETYNQHIDFLLMKIEASSDLVEKQKLLEEIIKLRKERRSSVVNNNAMISAVSELNKMHGYNSERLVIENESVTELDKRLAKLSDEELRKLASEEEQTTETTE